MYLIIGLVFLQAGVLAAASIQQPLSTPPFGEARADQYQFDWPIQKVAVIGAGPSGVVAYRELTEAGLDVRVFERGSVPGGIWHYTEEVPLDAPVPNAPVFISDFVPSLPPSIVNLPHSEELEDSGEVWRDYVGPKPVWESLTSNTAALSQQFTQWPWPAGIQWEVSHYQVRNYVRSYASYLSINSNDLNPAVAYNTRVERIEKRTNEAGQEQGWTLWLKSLKPTGNNTYRATWWTEDFDAVVVAAGKYNAPSVPSIPGLEEWVQKFPSLVRHSRQYRRPEAYTNQTVLIIGASASGSEISRDLNRHTATIYQSFRVRHEKPLVTCRYLMLPDKPGPILCAERISDLKITIPKNTTLVGEINQFLPIDKGSPIQSGLVELKNGTILSGIDSVILCTGFRYSFPFLPQYYDGAVYAPHEGSAKTVSPFLPLDGSHIRDLYLDVFYIQDPTLAFIGSSQGVQLFPFSEYTTAAVAKVWTNMAKLPSSRMMRELYEKTVEERGGYGKYLLFLGRAYLASVRYLIGWLNADAVKYGGKQIDGLPKYSGETNYYWQIVHYGGLLQERMPAEDEVVFASLGIGPASDADQGGSEYVPIVDDDW